MVVVVKLQRLNNQMCFEFFYFLYLQSLFLKDFQKNIILRFWSKTGAATIFTFFVDFSALWNLKKYV